MVTITGFIDVLLMSERTEGALVPPSGLFKCGEETSEARLAEVSVRVGGGFCGARIMAEFEIVLIEVSDAPPLLLA